MTDRGHKAVDLDGDPIDAEALARLRNTIPGADGATPLQLPRAAWWAIVKRVWLMTGFHNLSLLAAGVAYYAFLAFVPLIAAIVLIYGLVGDPETVTRHLDLLRGLAPQQILEILRQQLLQIVTTSKTAQGFGLALALLFSIYGAMRSSSAMIAALNIIYEEHETRGFLSQTGVAASMTLGMIGVALMGLVTISLVSYLGALLAAMIGTSGALTAQIGTWAVVILLIVTTFAIFFRYAPDRRPAKWRWLALGSVLATALWFLATIGLGAYVARISDYNATYGSLGAVVVFLLWLYLAAYAVLLGAELNSEMERQTLVDTTIGPDQPIGWRGAVMADSVAIDSATRALGAKRERRARSNALMQP